MKYNSDANLLDPDRQHAIDACGIVLGLEIKRRVCETLGGFLADGRLRRMKSWMRRPSVRKCIRDTIEKVFGPPDNPRNFSEMFPDELKECEREMESLVGMVELAMPPVVVRAMRKAVADAAAPGYEHLTRELREPIEPQA